MRTRLVSIAALLCLCLSASWAAAPDIVPNSRIGKIVLGMTATAVHNAVGKPSSSRTAAEGKGVARDSYQLSHDEFTFVYYLNGKVVQINTSSVKAATASGVKTYSPVAQMLKLYPKVKKSEVKLDEGTLITYDDVKAGIAFQSGIGEREDGKRLTAIVVHRAGVPALTF